MASLVGVTGTQAADQVLTGVISSASGQKLEGVTVSAKMEGSTITTSIYTDEKGAYYFPPMPAGKYKVWAAGAGLRDRQELRRSHRGDVTRTSCSRQSPIRSGDIASCRVKR